MIDDENFTIKLYFDKNDTKETDENLICLNINELIYDEEDVLNKQKIIEDILHNTINKINDVQKHKKDKRNELALKEGEFQFLEHTKAKCPKCGHTLSRYKIRIGTTLYCEHCHFRVGM